MKEIKNEMLSKMEDYEKKLVKFCRMIEDLRFNLYELTESLINFGEISNQFILPIDDWEAKRIDNKIIKITAPDYPIKYKLSDSSFKSRWTANTAAAINKLGHIDSIDKIAVLIRFHLPLKGWDIDNRDFKPIIDGIRYSGLIRSDTYENVVTIVEGDYCKEKGFTEIFITDIRYASELFGYLNCQ